MSFAARTVLVVFVAGLTVVGVWAASRIRFVADVELPPEPPPVREYPAGIRGQFVGTAGCLGAACHGAPARDTLAGKIDGDTWQSSGSCWVAADPHSAAYSLLTPEPYRPVRVKAEEIMAKYAPGTKATEDARCLACHTNPALAEPGKTNDLRVVSQRAEGVSCEGCHGNAGGWLHQHTTWKGDREKVYHETGMAKLYDLGERAAACAGCHIGAPEAVVGKLPDGREVKFAVRDMNHDMIAAGHPRLNFDFAEYLRRLPVHWQEKDRTKQKTEKEYLRGPDYLVKAWLVGRVAHAEAACKLLASRAERAQKNDLRTPWPEFAEFNCAACHHDLTVDGRKDQEAERPAPGEPWSSEWRRRPEVVGDRPLGVPPWQTIWPLTPAIGLKPQRPGVLFPDPKAANEPAARNEITRLLKEIQTVRPAGAGKVQPRAQDAFAVLGKLRTELSAWPDDKFPGPARKLFEVLARDGFSTPSALTPDWDSAVQVMFGVGALERRRIEALRRGAQPDARPNPVFQTAFDAYRDTKTTEQERWKKIAPALDAMFPRK